MVTEYYFLKAYLIFFICYSKLALYIFSWTTIDPVVIMLWTQMEMSYLISTVKSPLYHWVSQTCYGFTFTLIDS